MSTTKESEQIEVEEKVPVTPQRAPEEGDLSSRSLRRRGSAVASYRESSPESADSRMSPEDNHEFRPKRGLAVSEATKFLESALNKTLYPKQVAINRLAAQCGWKTERVARKIKELRKLRRNKNGGSARRSNSPLDDSTASETPRSSRRDAQDVGIQQPIVLYRTGAPISVEVKEEEEDQLEEKPIQHMDALREPKEEPLEEWEEEPPHRTSRKRRATSSNSEENTPKRSSLAVQVRTETNGALEITPTPAERERSVSNCTRCNKTLRDRRSSSRPAAGGSPQIAQWSVVNAPEVVDQAVPAQSNGSERPKKHLLPPNMELVLPTGGTVQYKDWTHSQFIEWIGLVTTDQMVVGLAIKENMDGHSLPFFCDNEKFREQLGIRIGTYARVNDYAARVLNSCAGYD